MLTVALMKTNVPGHTPRRGKVRDVYDLGDRLLLVATDRISAKDWVFPNGVPGKGKFLTEISQLWLDSKFDACRALGGGSDAKPLHLC